MTNKNIKFALLGLLFFSLSIFSFNLSETILPNENDQDNNITNKLAGAGFWNLTGTPIYIDDSAWGVGAHNWTWAENQPWCSGSGSWADPYIIENITINAQESSTCIGISHSDAYFIIRNCSLHDSGAYTGIMLNNVNNGQIIKNNCSENNDYGIYLGDSNNNTLSGNTADFNNIVGIYLTYSDNNTLSGNNATANNNGNNVNFGIGLQYSDGNNLSGNIATTNNDIGIFLHYSDNNTLSGNNASNYNGIGIFLDESNNNAFSGNNASNNIETGIYLGNSNKNTLSGNTANFNGRFGIESDDSNDNTLSGNNASNNIDNGIVLDESNNNTLSGNLMNFSGIFLSGSLVQLASHSIDDTNFFNNKPVYYSIGELGLESSNFTNAGQIILVNYTNSIISGLNVSNGFAISFYYCVNNTISGNIASNNTQYGMYFENCVNNTISGNIANDNGILGMYLFWNCNNNTLLGNSVSNNYYGMALEDSNNNKIFLNNYINNNINAADYGVNNKWDNGIIGNHWDDYTGVDANHDGIGDTPYLVPGIAGSQDNFPIYDNIAPVITIIFPLPDEVFGLIAPNYNISIDELYLDAIWYSLDGGMTNYTITSLTGTFNQTAWSVLSEGSVTIRFYANDIAGNISSAAVTVEKDISAPVISIIFPLLDEVFGLGAPNYNISINEPNLDMVWYSLNNGMNITITELSGTVNQVLWDTLPEGNITIRFYASDLAGNKGFQEVSVIKDTSQPTPPGIPGYDLLFLVGIISVMVVIIIKKRVQYLV